MPVTSQYRSSGNSNAYSQDEGSTEDEEEPCKQKVSPLPIRLSPLDIHTDLTVTLPAADLLQADPLPQRSSSSILTLSYPFNFKESPCDTLVLSDSEMLSTSRRRRRRFRSSTASTASPNESWDTASTRSVTQGSASSRFVTISPRCTAQQSFGKLCENLKTSCGSASSHCGRTISCPKKQPYGRCSSHHTPVAEPRPRPDTLDFALNSNNTRVRITALPDSPWAAPTSSAQASSPAAPALIEAASGCDACRFCNDVCDIDYCGLCTKKRATAKAGLSAQSYRGINVPRKALDFPSWFLCRASSAASGSIKSRQCEFTPCEVSRHQSRSKGCWLIAHNLVYDVTPFLDLHPAGPDCILKLGGKDATRDYDFHSREAQSQWKQYCIGKLVPCKGLKKQSSTGAPYTQWTYIFNQARKLHSQCTIS